MKWSGVVWAAPSSPPRPPPPSTPSSTRFVAACRFYIYRYISIDIYIYIYRYIYTYIYRFCFVAACRFYIYRYLSLSLYIYIYIPLLLCSGSLMQCWGVVAKVVVAKVCEWAECGRSRLVQRLAAFAQLAQPRSLSSPEWRRFRRCWLCRL
jgi:hypothetical protein